MPLRYKFLAFAVMSILAFFSVSYAQKKAQKKASKKATTKAATFISVPDRDVVRIDPEATIPVDFEGHKARILFQNLKVLIAEKNVKGSPVYGNLTTDDLFAFTPYYFNPTASVYALNDKDKTIVYNGHFWRLRSSDEFPEPDIEYVTACGMGGGAGMPPAASSREELIARFKLDAPPADSWRKSVFYVESFVPKTNRRNYRGHNVGQMCSEIWVPLRQTHYVLSFVSEQPFRLFNVAESIFSLDTYGYDSVSSMGFVSWLGTDAVPRQNPDSYLKDMFVVKLVPPYVTTKIFTKMDTVEKKLHIATQNQLVVDLVGVWLYDSRTGKVVSQNGAERVK